MHFCTFWRLKVTKLTKFRAPIMAKKAVLKLLDSPKLISPKIWVWQKNPEMSPLWLLLNDDSNDSKIPFCYQTFEVRVTSEIEASDRNSLIAASNKMLVTDLQTNMLPDQGANGSDSIKKWYPFFPENPQSYTFSSEWGIVFYKNHLRAIFLTLRNVYSFFMSFKCLNVLLLG